MRYCQRHTDPDVDCFYQIKKRIIAQRPLNLFKITQSLLTIIVSNIANPIVTNTGNANYSNLTSSTRPKNEVYGSNFQTLKIAHGLIWRVWFIGLVRHFWFGRFGHLMATRKHKWTKIGHRWEQLGDKQRWCAFFEAAYFLA